MMGKVPGATALKPPEARLCRGQNLTDKQHPPPVARQQHRWVADAPIIPLSGEGGTDSEAQDSG